MSSFPLTRTEYWNLSTNTVRGGGTAHGESLTDMENYLLPLAQMEASSFYTWGVVDGLVVTAELNQPGVTVSPGVALDAAGHVISLAVNGSAIVDPTVDPNDVQNIPIVLVGASGLTLSTAGASGDCFLTLTWREVLGTSQLGNAPVLIHAPWLRLVPVAGLQDDGRQVILAQATLDTNGLVTALAVAAALQPGETTARGRHGPATSLGAVRFRAPELTSTAGLADDTVAGELRAPDATTLRLAATDPAGRLELAAGQGPASGVTVIADRLSLHTAADTQGSNAINLDMTSATVTAGALRLGGAQAVAGELRAQGATTLRLAATDPAGRLELAAGQGPASGVTVIADRLSLHTAADTQGSNAINLDMTSATVTAGALRLGGAQSQVSLATGPTDDILGVTAAQLVIRASDGSDRIGLDGTSATVHAGKIGIGTTAPTQNLTLAGGNIQLPSAATGNDGNLYFGGRTDAQETGLRLFGGLVNGTIPAGFIDVRTSNPSDGLRIRVDTNDGGTERLRVTASGNVGVGTPAPQFLFHVDGIACAVQFCNPSDLRLKRDVTPLVDVLGRLASVRAVSYRPARGPAAEDAPRQVGVLAQDVLGAFPELVVDMGASGHQAVDYAALSAVLVGAVQELQASHAALGASFGELERRMAALPRGIRGSVHDGEGQRA